MHTLINKLQNRLHKEKGDADVITTLILTPIVLMLFFSIINVSLWLNAKAGVEASARDGVRAAAMWGGTSKNVRLNNSGKSIDNLIKERLYSSSKKNCTNSLCSKPPVVKCDRPTASSAGQKITCNITYYYKPVIGLDMLFGNMTSKPITYSISSVSETGYR